MKDTSLIFADQIFTSNYSMLIPEGKQVVNIKKNNQMEYPDLKLDLLGAYQRKNLPTVLKTVELLNEKNWQIEKQHIYSGLEKISSNTGLLGRWQVIGNNPLIVCDTAHNEAGIQQVVDQINNTAWKNLHIILGMVDDKNIDSVLKLLPKNACYYFTMANIPRAMDETKLKEKAAVFNLNGEVFSSVACAFREAKDSANEQDMIFIGGSTFVVAEIL